MESNDDEITIANAGKEIMSPVEGNE